MMKHYEENILLELQQDLKYNFKNIDLLIEALTHPSNIIVENKKNYERLEFLGDAVLNLIIAEILYNKFSDSMEDKLSSMRAKLISCDAICLVAERINLKDKIFLSTGEEKNGGRDNPRNTENTLEAIIGAIYLDSGLGDATRVVSELWNDILNRKDIFTLDPKTFLQEWSQKNKFNIPFYNVEDKTGPSHAPEFLISVNVKSVGSALGRGSNKKEAEKEAAKKFIEKFIDDE